MTMTDDKRSMLKSLLNNIINDKTEEASLDFHQYATAKLRDMSGIGTQPEAIEQAEVDLDDDNDN